MATELSQDAVLWFLQRGGGTVKNSDLILHFRNFIRDHPDRDRNRDLFKKFVNSVAAVKLVDGVSYVTLKRKFKGYVPGCGGDVGASDPPWVPAGASEPRVEPKEARAPAPPGGRGVRTVLPAAGILNNNNNVEEDFHRKQQQVNSTPDQVTRPVAAQAASHPPQKTPPGLSTPPGSDQASKGGQQRGGYGPLPAVTPAPPHRETNPGPEALRRRSQPEEAQLAPRRVRHRQSYKTAVSVDEEEELPPRQSSAGGSRPPNAPLSGTLRVTPAPSSVLGSYSQGTEGAKPTCGGPAGISLKQQQVNSSPGEVTRAAPAQVGHSPQKPELITARLSTAPASDQASTGGPQRGGHGPPPAVTPAPPHRETNPGPEALRRRSQPEEGLHQEAQLAPRRVKQRQSYKTAVSVDEDEEEELPMRQRSAGGSRSLNAALSDTRAADTRAPPAVPHIYIQDAEGETLSPHLETARHQDHRYSPPARGANQSPGSIPSEGGFSPGGSGWSSSSGDPRVRAGEPVGVAKTVQPTRETSRADRKSTLAWHRSTGQLCVKQEASARSSPLHRSTEQLHDDQLHDDQGSAARVMPWRLSTGDVCDREEVKVSDGSTSSPYLQHLPGVADQLGTKYKSRMCRSLGDDLDQLDREERGERGGGSEVARRSRLHRISSSLSLHNNLSCSSLSSCSTPPRSSSLASLDEAAMQKVEKTSASTEASPSSSQRDGRSRHAPLPLEPKEHSWLIKGAMGSWTDIYTLFRDDPSLLNRKDFISGFTVLHWIAKHGDHRVLNTLGYGVEKLGLAFDINARANSGHTPLHLAVMHGHKNMIRLLVKKFQADVKQRDVAGKRPWQYLSGDAPLEMFHMLGAPLQDVMGKKSIKRENSSWEQQQKQQKQQRESRRLQHHASSASGPRPLTVAGTVKVKRSTSLAAFLKHKSLQKFHVQQVDTSV